ncbi:hypothetical protein GCM10020367_54960 [Streptomyces sannanensis]|uniref:Type II restriction enzyme NaeI domain-containing protein n=1 Tax=Streptomyces sannanensis TaxID=285536 RepID=A0ABP6SIX1_9ACTN
MPDLDHLAPALHALRSAVPQLDGTGLAEALWLAARLGEEAEPQDTDVRSGTGDGPANAPGEEATSEPDNESRDTKADTPHAPAPGPATGERALHERLPGSNTQLPGNPMSAPRAPSPARSLDLPRALRPWKRRWPQGRHHVLDIDATVDAYAQSGELIPAFAAEPERWFDLVLIVETSPSMQVWQDTVDDFTTALGGLGAFRTLRTIRLLFGSDGSPELRDQQDRLVAPGRLRAPDGRQLIVVVSDCTMPTWREPKVWKLLREWAESTPTALLNPLPTKLWRRTGLNLPIVTVTLDAPGAGNTRLRYEAPLPPAPTGPEDGHPLPVPVLSLSPYSLARWSRAVMRNDPAGCSAALVPAGGRQPVRTHRPGSPRPLPLEVRAQGYLRTASPRAVRLAVLCSAFDQLSLRLLNVIRQELVPEATTADLAEMITSGLFSLETDADGIIVLGVPGAVRDTLREHLAEHEVRRMHRAVSRHIGSRGDGRAQLPSVAYDSESSTQLPAELQAFGHASQRTLELLGLSVPGAFTPRPSLYSSITPLPGQPRNFTGRWIAVSDMVRHLTTAASPVVCVSARDATRGAGKTALALQVAHLVRESFPHGQFFVDLRGSTEHPVDPDTVLPAFLTALGVPPESVPAERQARLRAYREAVAARRVLFVLDNAADAAQIRGLLPRSAGCAVIVTSVHALSRVAGAHRIELGPLNEEERLTLLIRIIGRGAVHRAPQAAKKLLDACCGWPLAIELLGRWIASGQAPAMDQLASDVDAKRRTLGPMTNSSTAVEAAFHRRFDALSAEEARACLLLALPEYEQLSAEEAMAIVGQSASGGLARALVSYGLLVENRPRQYEYQASFRHFARRLAAGNEWRLERRDAIARLLDHYCVTAAGLYTVGRPGDRLPERLGFAAKAVPHGMPTQIDSLVPNMLGIVMYMDKASLRQRAALLLLMQDLVGSRRHASLYHVAVQALIDKAADSDSQRYSLAAGYLMLGHIHLTAGRLTEAQAALTRAEQANASDAAFAGLMPYLHGTVALRCGAYEDAYAWLRRASAEYRAANDQHGRATAQLTLSELYLEQGKNDLAGQAAKFALDVFRELKATREVGNALRVLEASQRSEDGPAEDLLEAQREVSELYRTHGMRESESQVLSRLAQNLLVRGRTGEARQTAEMALQVAVDVGDVEGQGQALIVLGQVLLVSGGADMARMPWRQALDLLHPTRGHAAIQFYGLPSPKHKNSGTTSQWVICVPIPPESALTEPDAWIVVHDLILAHAGVQPHQVRSYVTEGVCLVLVDTAVSLAALLIELLDRFPGGLPARMAVHKGAVDTGSADLLSQAAIETTYRILFAIDVPQITDPRILYVSPSAFGNALRSPSGAALADRFVCHRGVDGYGALDVWTPIAERSHSADEELARLYSALISRDPEGRRFARLLRGCLDALLDGARTGRFAVRDLHPEEKSLIGRRVEEELIQEFGLEPDLDLRGSSDTRLDGIEFEINFSLFEGHWMFPPEAMDRICLVVHVDDYTSRWSAGLIRIRPGLLNRGVNRDMKRTLKTEKRGSVLWLFHGAELPENLLLHLDADTRAAILAPSSAQARINELFRRVQIRRIPLSALRTVAKQDDVARRVRTARRELEQEGFLILGHMTTDSDRARALRIPAPERGEYVSVRLTRLKPHHGDRPSVLLDGTAWTLPH